MEIVETQQQIQCHCCTSEEDVHICELDNCDYPLCSTCKEKALKLEHKCPGCRRSVIVNINDDSDDDLEPDLDNINRKCSNETIENCITFLYNWIMAVSILIIGTGILFILLMLGRLVSIIFLIGPIDFWCYSLGEHAFGYFIGYGLLGAILGFFIICCGGGLIFECVCKDTDD